MLKKYTVFVLSLALLIFADTNRQNRMAYADGNPIPAKSFVLSKDGKTDYIIVLPAEPTAVEQTAAQELKEHLDSVTGADFAVVSESDVKATQPQLVVGNSKRVKELLPDLDVEKIPYDGIVVKSVGNNIVLIGHPQRGTLYAVYSFLEETVGVRWWTSTESFIPKKPTLEIPEQNIEYAPKLIYRHTTYKDANDPLFAVRSKRNGSTPKITPKYGGHLQFFHFVHSFYALLPPKRYFDKHPEWYSEIDGQRKHEGATPNAGVQLCLTNDEMRAELTKNALTGLRRNPNAKFISVSQNDGNGGYCTCVNCKAVDDEEGGPTGSLIRFVNKVAEDVEKEFPDVWVETLAYTYTRKPPKFVRPRQNVVIRFCTYEGSFIQPIDNGEQNTELRKDIQDWSEIADNLFIWDYTVNFSAYMLPHPNHRVLAPNIQFYVEHNSIGIFAQGDVFCAAGDFVRMKTWVLSKLMWNPSLDAEKLFDEFLTGYYGPKYGPMLKEYQRILHDQAEQSGISLGIYRPATRDWINFDTWLKLVESLGNFEVCDESEFYKRFERECLPIRLVTLNEFYRFKRRWELSGKPVEGTIFEDPHKLLDTFFNGCKEHGVTAFRENHRVQPFDSIEPNMRARFGYPAAPPEFCKDLPRSSWFEIQSGDFELYELGEQLFAITDEQASDKRAVKMPGDHSRWLATHRFDDSILGLAPTNPQTEGEPLYRLYAAVRCDAEADIQGRAMSFGVFDHATKKTVVSRGPAVGSVRSLRYRWVSMGVIPLHPKPDYWNDPLVFWFAPPRRPGEVDAVYLDRIVVIREQ